MHSIVLGGQRVLDGAKRQQNVHQEGEGIAVRLVLTHAHSNKGPMLHASGIMQLRGTSGKPPLITFESPGR